MADPAGLLTGSGARFRNLTLRGPGDVQRDEIRALLTAARNERSTSLRGAS